MKKNKKIIAFIAIFCIHFGWAQNDSTTSDSKNKLLSYLDDMEKTPSPIGNQVYHMTYLTDTEFFEKYKIPRANTKTEMLLGDKKIVLDDGNMKVFGDDKNLFVILPKVRKIYWNNSDPKLFKTQNAQTKFLDIERALLKASVSVNKIVKNGIDYITITPNKEFENKTGLVRQMLVYNNKLKRVIRVENSYNIKSNIKKQVVSYEILDYKSTKKIKEPLEYIFEGKELKAIFRGFEIIDNRKK